MTHKAVVVADYLVNSCQKQNIKINSAKLQCLLLISQAASILINGEAMFEEKIEEIDGMPRIESVHKAYQEYKLNWITGKPYDSFAKAFSEKEERVMVEVIRGYGAKNIGHMMLDVLKFKEMVSVMD